MMKKERAKEINSISGIPVRIQSNMFIWLIPKISMLGLQVSPKGKVIAA